MWNWRTTARNYSEYFQNENIQTLKLWGRVLSKIKTDPVHRLLWSTVTTDDLLDTGASVEDTGGIIDELLATAPGMEMVILLKERPDGIIQGSIRSITPLCNSAEFSAEFGVADIPKPPALK